MIEENYNKDKIRKIVDPKSGFSLYLKKFKDSSLLHVSSDIAFSMPHENQNESNEMADLIQKQIEATNKNQKELSKHFKHTTQLLLKKNDQLKYIVYVLIGLCALSIFF